MTAPVSGPATELGVYFREREREREEPLTGEPWKIPFWSVIKKIYAALVTKGSVLQEHGAFLGRLMDTSPWGTVSLTQNKIIYHTDHG